MAVVLVALGAFAAMEVVSYAVHRWVMHGPGMVWHRSHHLPPSGAFEANDLFPLCFSALGAGAFALGAFVPRLDVVWWIGVGVTAYGVLYLVVHELYIHERLPVPTVRWRYLERLRYAHQLHHRFGGECYGMLVPIIPRALRERDEAAARADHGAASADLARRVSTRPTRARL